MSEPFEPESLAADLVRECENGHLDQTARFSSEQEAREKGALDGEWRCPRCGAPAVRLVHMPEVGGG